MSLTYVYEHSGMLRLFTLFNLCSILCVCYLDPVIKHISNSFTAAACSCCIVLAQAVHLTVLNILHDLSIP